MKRVLFVRMNDQPVGQLGYEDGFWTFQYSPEWLTAGFPLSPAFPLRVSRFADERTTRHVAWFFDNLLPEEAAREVLAKDANVPVDDAWGLLAYSGAELAGAISVLCRGDVMTPTELVRLSDGDLQRRIDRLPKRSLSAGAPQPIALAGAQHKLAVALVEGELFEPAGSACSTHILKPDSKSNEYPHTAANEYFCMQLAAALKLSVPATAIRYVPWPVYEVERFDRAVGAERTRKHVLDALQLLSLSRELKYQKASAATLSECIDLCASPQRAKLDIFAWVVFNVLTGNADAHMKNISFILDASGIRVAPFYDLVSTVVYATPQYDKSGPHWPQVALSMPLGRATLYSQVTRDDLVYVANELGLPSSTALRCLDELVGNAAQVSADLLQKALAIARPGEARLLNLIHELPVKEMSARLATPRRLRSGARRGLD